MLRRILFGYFLIHKSADAIPSLIRRTAVLGMVGMVLVSFLAANVQALLWQSSEWLVSTVLPGVIVELTNEERVAEAVIPLQRNAVLDEAARLKAEHMATEQYFAHYSPDGVSPWDWFEEVRYTYAHAGENLAIHFSDSGEVVEAWMDSPSHRANIVNGNYTEIGVGTAKGVYEGYETVFVVQLFGTPASPVVIPDPVPAAATVYTAPTIPIVASSSADSINISMQAVPVVAAETIMATPTTRYEVASSATTTMPVAMYEVTTPKTEPMYEEAATLVVDEVYSEGGVVSLYSSTIATSSGLPVLLRAPQEASGTTKTAILARVATQPNLFLQTIYMILGTVVAGMLLLSFALAWRTHQPRQVAYSVALMGLMGGLVALHLYLTSGAVIV